MESLSEDLLHHQGGVCDKEDPAQDTVNSFLSHPPGLGLPHSSVVCSTCGSSLPDTTALPCTVCAAVVCPSCSFQGLCETCYYSLNAELVDEPTASSSARNSRSFPRKLGMNRLSLLNNSTLGINFSDETLRKQATPWPSSTTRYADQFPVTCPERIRSKTRFLAEEFYSSNHLVVITSDHTSVHRDLPAMVIA